MLFTNTITTEIDFYKNQINSDFNSLDYWDGFYKSSNSGQPPSLFAEYCLDKINRKGKLFELGCGNGRDAIFFSKHGINVIACDQCERALLPLNQVKGIYTVCTNFQSLSESLTIDGITDIYSRFSLHAVTKEIASLTLIWCKNALSPEGRLFIETRSIFDELYGVGEEIAKDTFKTDHCRRFIRPDELYTELENLGFNIELFEMNRGFAPYKNEDPIVIRVIAKS